MAIKECKDLDFMTMDQLWDHCKPMKKKLKRNNYEKLEQVIQTKLVLKKNDLYI